MLYATYIDPVHIIETASYSLSNYNIDYMTISTNVTYPQPDSAYPLKVQWLLYYSIFIYIFMPLGIVIIRQ